MITYLLTTFGSTFVCYTLFVGASNYFYDSSCPLNINLLSLDLISQSLETMGDAYMCQKIIKHFSFFLNIKIKKLNKDGLRLTCFNKVMLAWLVFIVTINMFDSVSRLFFIPFIENRIVGNKNQDFAFIYETIDLWILNAVNPLNEMLN
jgi:hypothetical protein